MNNSFSFEGEYRVQSARALSTSVLRGVWFSPDVPCLTREDMNQFLASQQNWLGRAKVTLRAAWIEERAGAFASHADALYYHKVFSAKDGSPRMKGDILDVSKLMAHWTRRGQFLRTFFSIDQYETLLNRVGSVERTATNEYMCHEAGHLLGVDIHTKYDGGHFRAGGRLAWPLIYVEEFRADLESFACALDCLSLEQACAVFNYHICHRFGLACESGQTDCESAGAVPYLLYYLLRELGVLGVRKEKGRTVVDLNIATTAAIADAMRVCAKHATKFLTLPELSAKSLLDAAIVGATYYRERALDEVILNEFWGLVCSPHLKTTMPDHA
ncbi:MAG: hypothetical protein ACJ754_23585 [Pyrinomonadaceae bacterium]